MSMNLLSLPADDAERLAYAEGFTMAAELKAKIEALTQELDEVRALIEQGRKEARGN